MITGQPAIGAPERAAPRRLAWRRGWRLAPWIYALALVWWAASWNLRFSVLMSWSPVEPVWVGSGAVALCVVHRCGQSLRLSGAVAAPVLLLVLGFLPGAVLSSGQGYGPVKLTSMIFILLPVFCAATLLLDSRAARRGWLLAQAIAGVAVAVAALELRDAASAMEPGRFSLASVDTISSSRFVGVAVVVLVLLGLSALRHSWWALPLAAVCGVALVHIGSRGPVLAVLGSVGAVVLVGRCYGRMRLPLLLAVLAASYGAFRYAVLAGGSGGQRIIGSLESGFADGTRSQLLDDAFRLGSAHPMGIGWGDFAQYSDTGREIANNGVSYAHNVFAEMFSEGGAPALLAFSLVVLLALWRQQRITADPLEAVVLGTTVYWLLNAQFSSDVIGNRFMWIALACGIAAYVPLGHRSSRMRSPDAEESMRKGIGDMHRVSG